MIFTFRYIKKLSGQSNYVTRLMREAVTYYQDGRYDDAFLEYLVLAEADIEIAQYNLGWLCQEFQHEVCTTCGFYFTGVKVVG